jgi:phospholipase/lecithinase/hemolysin
MDRQFGATARVLITPSAPSSRIGARLAGRVLISVRHTIHFRCAAAALLTIVSSATGAQAISAYSQIIAFGDSYSDSGNIARTTDAENWLEYLAADLNIPGGMLPSNVGGTNYSRGTATTLGSSVFDFASQLRTYSLQFPVADSDALYVVWLGFNDILLAENEPNLKDFADAIASGIGAGMRQIWQAGGRHFLLPNAWDITTTPFSALAQSPEVREEKHALHTLFNESLSAVLDEFPVPVHRLDVFGLSRNIFVDPALFGFTEGRSVCPSESPTCEGFIWKDLIHPSSDAHRILADRALAAIPEPPTALLLGFGLVILEALKRELPL